MGHRLSKSVSSVANNLQQQHQQQQRSKNSKNHSSERGSSSLSLSSTASLSSSLSLSSHCPHHHQNYHNQEGICNILASSSNQGTNLSSQQPLLSSSSDSTVAATSTIEIDATTAQNLRLESATLTVPAAAQVAAAVAPRRFIIKIQLTKMEPGSNNVINDCDITTATATLSTTVAVNDDSINNSNDDNSTKIANTIENVHDHVDNNLNIAKPIINLTFTKNIPCDESSTVVLTTETADQQEQWQQKQQIIIESNNEKIQLNNLNATGTNANLATINSNFVNNFATNSLTAVGIHQMDGEGNNIVRHLDNLSLQPTTTNAGFIFRNADNDCDISMMNLNCLNNNISGSSSDQMMPTNSISNRNQKQLSGLDSDQQQGFNSTMCASNEEDEKSHCCRRKKSSAYPAKWRCCRCSCRDSVKLTNTTSTVPAINNGKESTKSSKSSWTSKFNCTKKDSSTSSSNSSIGSNSSVTANGNLAIEPKQQNIAANFQLLSSSSSMLPSSESPSLISPSSATSGQWISSPDVAVSVPQLIPVVSSMPSSSVTVESQSMNRPIMTCPRSDHLTMWEPVLPLTPFIDHHHHHHHHHHIQTIARCPGGGSHNLFVFSVNHPTSQQSSQIVIGQIEDLDERARRLRALEIENGMDPLPSELESALANVLSPQNSSWHHIMCAPSNFGTVVHSQVDYIHCLVPDLEKITSSSFYWGKMDRYEAERLLEGKPEGTFLLRDSAQEEYLFSVTFRKYGRSLHARIEQLNHKFSFDGHDPGVFTASTVTGLLEHYKDPSCVMFFEPMLTIPLHRNFTFSLQQLCRATIVSHITYDGINELHLPNSLKSYLKEYHYKLRVRVKPFDEPFYTCS